MTAKKTPTKIGTTPPPPAGGPGEPFTASPIASPGSLTNQQVIPQTTTNTVYDTTMGNLEKDLGKLIDTEIPDNSSAETFLEPNSVSPCSPPSAQSGQVYKVYFRRLMPFFSFPSLSTTVTGLAQGPPEPTTEKLKTIRQPIASIPTTPTIPPPAQTSGAGK